VSQCRTHVASDTYTYYYTELCDFLKLLAVSMCQYPCRVQYPCLYLCFIGSSSFLGFILLCLLITYKNKIKMILMLTPILPYAQGFVKEIECFQNINIKEHQL